MESIAATAATPADPKGRAIDDTDGLDRRVEGDARDETAQFVTFKVGHEEYGVDIMRVREIKGWTETTSLPNSPAYMRGVLNLRGTIVPIYDLRARFGLGETAATSVHVIVIVAVRERLIGILVDAVSDILTVAAAEIRPVPETERGRDQKFLSGLVSFERRMVALLELERMFDLTADHDAIATAA